MNIEDRIAAFEKLGNYLGAIDEVEFKPLAEKARNENGWFTDQSIKQAFRGLEIFLNGNTLRQWTASYELTPQKKKTVAVVMAGNIPLVGFHDFLAVLISGHSILMKNSSKDSVLLDHLTKKLTEIEPRFSALIGRAEQLRNFDAVIATGSDNSARYFHYYFSKYPHIIRKNRTSCAVLNGKETAAELIALGSDVFTYFGLGCRNVSKIFIPENYDLTSLLKLWDDLQPIIHHHKYNNNYDYQKSILLINRIPFLDSGFLLLQESEKLVSPISVLYYERYTDEAALALKLTGIKDKLQCIVGKTVPGSIGFGQSQQPKPWDYADQVDTLRFLDDLS